MSTNSPGTKPVADRWHAPLGRVKYCSDLPGEAVHIERFVHKLNALIQYAVLHNEILRVSRHVEHLQSRTI